MKRFVFAACFFLIACTQQATEQPPPSYELVVYGTVTPSLTSTPNLVINVETPVPSATPFTYTVKSGDTLSRIAEHFHVSLDALQLANPDVTPNGLAVGTVLQIPSSSNSAGSASTPTPVPVPITQTSCYPSADRGMWCLALVNNDSSAAFDNISAQITLIDSQGAVIASQVGLTPLDTLSPNTALPIYVFFPPDVPVNATAQVQLLSAVTLAPDDSTAPRRAQGGRSSPRRRAGTAPLESPACSAPSPPVSTSSSGPSGSSASRSGPVRPS